jgi:hypothetical protein
LTKATHITPADGNVFLDFGFEPEEAAKLLENSNMQISMKSAKKSLSPLTYSTF